MVKHVIVILAAVAFLSGCQDEREYQRAKKDADNMVLVCAGCATNEPSVFEYKRDGVTYLIFKDGNGLAVIRHQ